MEEDGLWRQGVNQRRLPELSGSVVRPDPMRNLITLTKFLSNESISARKNLDRFNESRLSNGLLVAEGGIIRGEIYHSMLSK